MASPSTSSSPLLSHLDTKPLATVARVEHFRALHAAFRATLGPAHAFSQKALRDLQVAQGHVRWKAFRAGAKEQERRKEQEEAQRVRSRIRRWHREQNDYLLGAGLDGLRRAMAAANLNVELAMEALGLDRRTGA